MYLDFANSPIVGHIKPRYSSLSKIIKIFVLWEKNDISPDYSQSEKHL